jgi:hypothetical protein
MDTFSSQVLLISITLALILLNRTQLPLSYEHQHFYAFQLSTRLLLKYSTIESEQLISVIRFARLHQTFSVCQAKFQNAKVCNGSYN